MKNIQSSQHWFVLALTLMIPTAIVILDLLLNMFDAKTTSGVTHITTLNMFYAGVAMWWVFAAILVIPGNQNITKDSPKFGRWLFVLPVSMFIINWFTPFDPYLERMSWFNSIVVTWFGMVGWILVDWYRWVRNPTLRQFMIMDIRRYYAERQAKIDKIPDCMIPSNLRRITPEESFTGDIT